MTKYAYSFESRIANLTIYEVDNKIVRIEFNEENIDKNYKYEMTPTIKNAIREIEEYLDGDRKIFTVPIELYGTEFQVKVWNELLKIPYGETKTYKEIAKSIGNEKACRAVGGANNKNPIPIIVPCHRVIGSNSSLVGYKGGLQIKKALLEVESTN
ncbi:MAG TPA: methylated-DNA--[protein]-cysteine S-methyltransferase [Soehngenia sp.]|nr:methylated-DNA--[protein]-cysteine S-methyltransferase [Soehngenia sp.]